MGKTNELNERRETRMPGFDYSTTGAYFVTICVQDRKQLLSRVAKEYNYDGDTQTGIYVGEGLAPPEYTVVLKPCGEVAKNQLHSIENRFPNVKIDDYIIMPDHIHAIIFFREKAGGASPSPTLNDVICAFKSLTSRICKQKYGIEHIFQRSYYDHIIRSRDDYDDHIRYICGNPHRWYCKHTEPET